MTPRPTRPLAALLGLAACFAFSSCENTKSTASAGSDGVVDYTSPTTRMSKKEKENYAFDDSGRYRENWVAANSTGRSVGIQEKTLSTDSPYVQEDTAPSPPEYTTPRSSNTSSGSSSSTPPRKTVSTSSSSGSRKSSSSSGTRKKSVASTASKSKKKPASKSAAKPTVVTVKSGDTLHSFSRKTGVSVERIKAYNGLKSDLIVDGKTLKIPPKR